MSSDEDKEHHGEDERTLESKDPRGSNSGSARDIPLNEDSIAKDYADSPSLITEKAEGSSVEGHQSGDGSEDEDDSIHSSGEDDSDSEEEEDDDDDDDESEPALKYTLLGGTMPVLLRKDSASALAVSSKLIVSNELA